MYISPWLWFRSSPVQMVLSAKLIMVARYVVSLAMADFISNSAI